MKFTWILKSLFPVEFRSFIKKQLGYPTLTKSLENLKRLGWSPRVVIDGGAYEGKWTREFLNIFPSAKVLLIEAQKDKIPIIRKNCRSNVIIVNELLSSQNEHFLFFNYNETASSVVNTEIGSTTSLVKCKTLDTLINELNLTEIDLLKLDVQGHEIEVLKGAKTLLISVEFVLLEMTLMRLSNTDPLLVDVLNYMDNAGFQLYDIISFTYKPFDNALYQVDGMFVKKDSKFINTNW